MEVSRSGCSSVSLELPDFSNGTTRQVLPREDYSKDIVVVLASVTGSDHPCLASVIFLYGNAAAEASASVFAAYTLFWIEDQPGPITDAGTALGSQA